MEKILTVKDCGFAGVLWKGSVCKDRAVIYADGGGSSREEATQAAAFIRNAGFTVLVLGYYGWEGTPDKMENIPVEYAERAAGYLRDRLGIENIIMAGVSEGAVYTLLCASLIPDIHAVCVVVPMDYVMVSPLSGGNVSSVFTWRGRVIPFSRFSVSEQGLLRLLKGALFTKGYGFRRAIRYACDQVKPDEDAFIKVENMRAELLMIAPGQDDIWPSDEAVNRILERLRKHEYRYPVLTELYPSGSHLMGGSHDLSEKGLRLFKHLLKSEHDHPAECDAARTACLKRMLLFFRELSFPCTAGQADRIGGEEA